MQMPQLKGLPEKKHLLYQTHKRIINYVCEHRKSEEICVWQWIRKQTSDICFLGI